MNEDQARTAEPYDKYITSPSLPTCATNTSSPARQSSPSNGSIRSLVHALGELSQAIPNNVAYTFLNDGDEDETNITYRELDLRAQAIAARLQSKMKQGDRAALVYVPSLEYIAALVGCFYAGIVAVPVYPPDPMRIQRTVSRLQAILSDAEADVILTGPEEYRRFASLLECGEVIDTTQIAVEESMDWEPPEITPDTLAFLQYTSGSTGTPKGVMLTHSNLMFNFEHIKKFDEPNAVAVSWLPMYHDMGLIGLVLQALQSGRRTVLMSPLSFVKRPFRWLKAISKYRAYATSGPSFAYELCVQKISDEELKQLDLSCWTLACNGAEPIRVDTLQRFTERFAECGFRPETFYPCYGLAEATLIVSGGEKKADPVVRYFNAAGLDQNIVEEVDATAKGARAIVGCGGSVTGQQIAIVNPDTRKTCESNQVGEIWVKGPGVAQGYWQNPETSEETFRAQTSDTSVGPYLRTGDLGFMVDGELFVTGRIKDLIIIRGRNHYPQDIERTVESCHKSLRRDHGAAFAVDVDGEERLVVVQGIVRPQRIDLDQLLAEIRTALLHEHELSAFAIVLVKCGEIPRTSSGKIQRRNCRELYEEGDLEIVAEWMNDGTGNEIAEANSAQNDGIVADEDSTDQESIDPQKNLDYVKVIESIVNELKDGVIPENLNRQTMIFADLNLESIDLVMLNEMIEQHYKISFPFQDFMTELGRQNQRDISLGQFADFLAEHHAS